MTPFPGRPDPAEYAPFEEAYVSRVPDGDLLPIVRSQLAGTVALIRGIPEAAAGLSYAPGKWSVKEMVGHLADTERIMAYRALRIARGDETPLPGFAQDDYVPPGAFNERTLASLLAELEVVRAATLALFENLPRDAWGRRGTACDVVHSVRSIAYVIAGHELHHRRVLEERYLPALVGAPQPPVE